MPNSFPYSPDARTKPWNQTPDWASSDFQDFEKAVDGGAPSGVQRVAQNQNAQVNKDKGATALFPQLGQWNRWLVEQNLAAPDEVDSFNTKALKYFGPRVFDWSTLGSIGGNKPGTITRDQDALARKLFNAYKDDPQMAEQFKN